MGVGEEALGAHLASEGWSLKPGVLAHFGQLEDLASARRALLDADLYRVGAPIALARDARQVSVWVSAGGGVLRDQTTPAFSRVRSRYHVTSISHQKNPLRADAM